ncbi:hypothetical protein HanRHA438_Chr09g0400301 [Helianthus annuus]|nr:hypothetical protein HanRHA438_Chr09g0400301 [Helianthus annuus]
MQSSKFNPLFLRAAADAIFSSIARHTNVVHLPVTQLFQLNMYAVEFKSNR